MFVTTHVLMGGLIGQNTPTPIVATLLGVVSHFLLDMIPHGDSHLYYAYKEGKNVVSSLVRTTADAVAAVVILVYMLETAPYPSRSLMVCAVIGSIIPDFLVGLSEVVPVRPLKWFARTHMRIHDSVQNRVGFIRPRYGLYLQVVIFFFLFFLVTVKPLK